MYIEFHSNLAYCSARSTDMDNKRRTESLYFLASIPSIHHVTPYILIANFLCQVCWDWDRMCFLTLVMENKFWDTQQHNQNGILEWTRDFGQWSSFCSAVDCKFPCETSGFHRFIDCQQFSHWCTGRCRLRVRKCIERQLKQNIEQLLLLGMLPVPGMHLKQLPNAKHLFEGAVA